MSFTENILIAPRFNAIDSIPRKLDFFTGTFKQNF